MTGTLHDELVDELRLLVDGLKDQTERGTAPREFLNGLLRDCFLLEETAGLTTDLDDTRWLEPFLQSTLAKLAIGPRVLPQAAGAFQAAAIRVGDLLDRDELLAELRVQVPALLREPEALRPEARARLEKGGVRAALESKRLLRSKGGAPAEVALVGRLIEGLGLHLALNRCEGKPGQRDEEVRSLVNRLEGFLAARATLERPETGSDARQGVVSALGSLRVPGVRAGQVAEVTAPGFTLNGERLCFPVVVASAGAEAKVLSAARQVLQGAPEADARRVLPFLEAVGAALNRRTEDPDASDQDRAAAALDVVGAVLPVLDDPAAQATMLRALAEDFPGKDVELLLPAPGAPMAEGLGWEARDVFSRDVAVGTITRLLRPGIKLGGEVVRPALVQVSQGPPPPSILDEVLELL
ncbi:MAG: hypothetical protein AB7T09_37730, partial [Planctomycetota bacterium]